MSYRSEISYEIQQRQRAATRGALVRPPRQLSELEADENANSAEIDMLEERRSSLYRQQGQALTERHREDISYDLASCAKALELAFAARRRLRVARKLFHEGVFA